MRSRVHTLTATVASAHNGQVITQPARSIGDRAVATEVILPAPDDGRRRSEDEHWSRRRDIERQLHDGPALRIAALTLHLGLLRQRLQPGAGNLQRDIDDLQGQLHMVLQELRAIADRIYPPLLHEAGLAAALWEVATRARVSVHVDVVDERFDAAVEGVAYFAALEVLDHLDADAAAVDVMVRRDGDCLVLDLANVDTRHVAPILDRIQGLGGAVDIEAEPTIGTIRVRIPCE